MMGSRVGGAKMDAVKMEAVKTQGSQAIKAPAEVCPLCEGTGWKTVKAGAGPGGSTNDRRVTRCDCRLRARGESLLAAARIPRRYEHCELSNFEFDGPYRSLAPARMAACKFVEEYPIDKTGLLVIGTIGVGKTHLAVGMIKELVLGKGIACLFYDYRELLKQIQNSYNDSVKTTELDVLRPVFETEVLVLDELGAVRPTEWVWDTVSLILNTRYNDNRTTIITTNYPNLAGTRPARRPREQQQPRGRQVCGRKRDSGRSNRRSHALPPSRNVPHRYHGRPGLPGASEERQLSVKLSCRMQPINFHSLIYPCESVHIRGERSSPRVFSGTLTN